MKKTKEFRFRFRKNGLSESDLNRWFQIAKVNATYWDANINEQWKQKHLSKGDTLHPESSFWIQTELEFMEAVRNHVVHRRFRRSSELQGYLHEILEKAYPKFQKPAEDMSPVPQNPFRGRTVPLLMRALVSRKNRDEIVGDLEEKWTVKIAEERRWKAICWLLSEIFGLALNRATRVARKLVFLDRLIEFFG